MPLAVQKKIIIACYVELNLTNGCGSWAVSKQTTVITNHLRSPRCGYTVEYKSFIGQPQNALGKKRGDTKTNEHKRQKEAVIFSTFRMREILENVVITENICGKRCIEENNEKRILMPFPHGMKRCRCTN